MKKDKKILIIIICSILLLLSLLTIFLISANKNKDNEEVITTTTTEKIKEFKELIDEKTKISIKLTDEKYYNNKLLIENIENVVIENIILAYDINLLDENNNKVQVENTNLFISIPYVNVNSYSQFKVLHIDENNNVLETINASYENEKINFNVNHLSRYAILGIKDDELTTTTTKVSTTKKNNNSKTTTKADTSNKTTANNDSKKEWTVTFYVDGKVSSVVKVKDGNTVAKPKNPSDKNNQVFSHWVNSWTGEKFDFNTKIHKNYEVFADYKIKDDSITTTTATTTKAVVNTTTKIAEHPKVTESPKNIYFTNEKYAGKSWSSSGAYVSWDKVNNADYYNIYYSNTKNGVYEKVYKTYSFPGHNIELKEGFYRISGSNSHDEEGPKSDALFVPGQFNSNISTTLTCIQYYDKSDKYLDSVGKISINNPNNYNIALFKGLSEKGYKTVEKIYDLSVTDYRTLELGCPKKTYGNYYYYVTVAYKKTENYIIYAKDYNNIDDHTYKKEYID